MFCSYNPLHIYDKVFSNATLHLVFQFYDFPCSATIDANILFPMTPINSSIMFSTNNVWTHTVTISCDDVYWVASCLSMRAEGLMETATPCICMATNALLFKWAIGQKQHIQRPMENYSCFVVSCHKYAPKMVSCISAITCHCCIYLDYWNSIRSFPPTYKYQHYIWGSISSDFFNPPLKTKKWGPFCYIIHCNKQNYIA